MDRWCAAEGIPRGEILTLDQGWRLARAWYGDRLDPGWRRKTAEEAAALFAELGLTSPFWSLKPGAGPGSTGPSRG